MGELPKIEIGGQLIPLGTQYYNTKDAAKMLGVSLNRLKKMLKDGDLKYYRLPTPESKMIRINEMDILDAKLRLEL